MMKAIRPLINQLKSEQGKVLIENFFFLGGLKAINLILPLVVLPYLISVIGFHKYGIIVFANSFIAYFHFITDYSFAITGVRDIAIYKGDIRKLSIIYSKIMTVKIFLLIISFVLITIFILVVPFFRESYNIYFLCSLTLLGYVLFPEWFFQGIEKMKYITYLNMGVKIFFTIFVFILVKDKDDYWLYPVLQSLGLIAAGLVGQYILLHNYNIKIIPLSIKILKKTMVENFPVFINQFIPTLFLNTTIFIMGWVIPKSKLGIFDAIRNIILLESVPIDVVSRVTFPYLNRNKGQFSSIAKFTLIIYILIISFVLLIHPILFKILKIDGADSLVILSILSFGMLFIGIYNIFSTNFLLVHRMDKLVMKITIYASITGFILSYPLIILLGEIGGAINIMISQIILGLLSYNYYRVHQSPTQVIQ